jgi:hypothetical protein
VQVGKRGYLDDEPILAGPTGGLCDTSGHRHLFERPALVDQMMSDTALARGQ